MNKQDRDDAANSAHTLARVRTVMRREVVEWGYFTVTPEGDDRFVLSAPGFQPKDKTLYRRVTPVPYAELPPEVIASVEAA